jgi:dCTP deaminase
VILTGPEIIHQYRTGRITLDPFRTEQVNPNSYNYRLGDELIEFTNSVLDPKRSFTTRHHHLKPAGFVLRPGRLYLAHTHETIGSDHFVTSLIGRSTMGRLGLWLQVTADLGHIGNHHRWTLEFKVVQPLRIYPGMQIGQVTFWCPRGRRRQLYRGKYARHITAEPSHIRVELT